MRVYHITESDAALIRAGLAAQCARRMLDMGECSRAGAGDAHALASIEVAQCKALRERLDGIEQGNAVLLVEKQEG